ncbi:MAG TPA: NUDIX domain-containing protein [Candidatus Dormibacteraeota bacterium]|nr:NUDIX domain-containing protein [Candidatus Dormibacteraeota bacterium]
MTTVAHCPHCAEPAEQPLVCSRCGWRWFANPVPAAGTLVERVAADGEPEVLVLRRAIEPGLGAWDLPAGYLDPGESPEEGARRETLEEAGLAVELVRLVGVYTSRAANAVSCVYLAHPLDPAAAVVTDPESDDHAWVARGDVPAWLPRMAFPSMAAALDDWAAGRNGLARDW